MFSFHTHKQAPDGTQQATTTKAVINSYYILVIATTVGENPNFCLLQTRNEKLLNFWASLRRYKKARRERASLEP